MNKTKEIILLFIGIFSLLLITAGVTYSIFTYTRTGTTDAVTPSPDASMYSPIFEAV